MVKSPKELLKEELVCIHTKTPLAEATLGIGLAMKKNPVNGMFRFVHPTLDLINMRAFTKIGVRTSIEAERFTHWLPLFFGETDDYVVEKEHYDHELEEHVKQTENKNMKQRFDVHLMNSLAFICNGRAKNKVNEDQVLNLFYSLIMTHGVDMSDQSRHMSIVSLRRMFNFIRLAQLVMGKLPKMVELIDNKLETFIKDPSSRLKGKEFTPNLGIIMIYAILSSKYTVNDIIDAYLEE